MAKLSASDRFHLWALLLLAPWLLFGFFLLPGFGTYEQGLWPEWFFFDRAGDSDFQELASAVRTWSIAALILAAAIAWGVYAWTRHTWRERIRTFDVRSVAWSRSLVAKRTTIAFLGSVTVAILFIVLSESLRQAEYVSWVIFAALVGAFGGIQLMATMLGRPSTNRLFFG